MTLLDQGLSPLPRVFSASTNESDAPGWQPARAGRWLAVLLVFCLVPRLLMAWQLRAVCDDAYYYVSIAAAFQDGQWAEAFSYLNLNIYPLILLALNRLGLEWVLAGKLWGAVISSLAVLPLFGWVRRLFDDRVAWAACFLYAIHPEFIELSVEPIRDPTFWFLWTLCLYLSWRAVSEAKFRWFLAGGLSLALAIHVRSEGWLLAVPFVIWMLFQAAQRTAPRVRLLAGAAVWLGVAPVLVLLVNLTVLRAEPEWHVGRLAHFEMGWTWLKARLDPTSSPHPKPERTRSAGLARSTTPRSGMGCSPPLLSTRAEEAPTSKTKPTRVRKFVREFISAMEPFNLVVMVLGLWWSGRSLFRWEKAALFLLALLLAVAIWVLFDQQDTTNGRYFMPIYLAMVPFAAVGLLLVLQGLWASSEFFDWKWWRPLPVVCGLIVLAATAGWADALTTWHDTRERDADFGAWLGETWGPFQLAVTDQQANRAGYFAQGTQPALVQCWGTMEWQFRGQPLDLLILSWERTPRESHADVYAAAARMGLQPLPLPVPRYAHGRYLIFVRPRPASPTLAAADVLE